MPSATVFPLTSFPLLPIDKNSIFGTIYFTQQDENKPVDIRVNIENIPAGTHAFNINTFGDVSNGALTTGRLFRQLHDVEAKRGSVHNRQQSKEISLFEENANFIIGKAVVVYAGSSGEPDNPIACGVIGLADSSSFTSGE